MNATTADRYILRVEQVICGSRERRFDTGDKLFCLGALLNASPTNANSKYGMKMIMNNLLAQPGDMLICPMEGCEVAVPKANLEAQEGICALASFCLKEAWDVRNDENESSERIWETTTRTSEQLHGACIGGYRCPNPLCEFSAGWSEDAIPGTVGVCAKREA